jgi:hypothetical protein
MPSACRNNGRIIRGTMDDERFERMLHLMAKQIVELNSDLLELTASVTALMSEGQTATGESRLRAFGY